MTTPATPNIEERLSAAAFQILTDGLKHSLNAQRWAARFMRQASRGRPTEFQRQLRGVMA